MRVAVARVRLRNHHLSGDLFARPAEVVRAFGAMQAQDYPGALWAVAQRTAEATEADVEDAIAARTIIRTWPMRGTLHFVAPELVRPTLRLLAPRVIRRAARRYEELGLDAATFKKSRALFEKALDDGRPRTRDELYDVLARAKIDPKNQRGIHLLGHHAMGGVLCFGPRRGKQPTFTLLDEWLPPATKSIEDDALPGELARRYFAMHGPATTADFSWWTGLSLGDARRAIASAGLSRAEIDHREMWGVATRPVRSGELHLLPAYDEFTVGYRDRSDFLDAEHTHVARGGIFSPVIALDGRLVGTWGRRTTRKGVTIAATFFAGARPDDRLAREAARYGRFLGVTATLA
jgi:hypothetical protein